MLDLTDVLNGDSNFRYRLLGRMCSDCEYYLGYGNRCSKHLWAGNESDQIACMKALWKSFSDDAKPEWLSYEKILDYEACMVPEKALHAVPIQHQLREENHSMNEFERLHRQAEIYKEQYPHGTRILLISMGTDIHRIQDNTRATVDHVDDLGTLHCNFDNGRRFGVIPGADQFRKLTEKELAEEAQQKASLENLIDSAASKAVKTELDAGRKIQRSGPEL